MDSTISSTTQQIIKEAYQAGFSTQEIARSLELKPKAVLAYMPSITGDVKQVAGFFLNEFVKAPDFDAALSAWDVSNGVKQILFESSIMKQIQKDLADAKLFHAWQSGVPQRTIAVQANCSQSYLSRKIKRFSKLYKDEFMKTKTTEGILADIQTLNPIPPLATAYGLLSDMYKLTQQDVKVLCDAHNIDLAQVLQNLREVESEQKKEALADQVLTLYKEGRKQQEIADFLDIQQAQVSRIVVQHLGLQNPRIINTETEDQIISALQAGQSDTDILEQFGISSFTLRNIKIRNQFPYTSRKNYTEYYSTILKLSKKGLTPSQISEVLNLDPKISAALNLNPQIIYPILYRQRKKGKLSVYTQKNKVNQVIELCKNGVSRAEISEATNLKLSTINGIVQKWKTYEQVSNRA